MTTPHDESLESRLAGERPLLLDGATGTELERAGIGAELPLWSATALDRAPDAVTQIHHAYARAGADILTANTFRTQRRVLAKAGWADRAAELTTLAVRLARDGAAGAEGRRVLVAGSAPPLEDCYRPDLVPPDAELCREHAEHAENLAEAGVDAVLAETMNTAREAAAACGAARAVGLPCLVSFVCWDGARLLSGEPLAEAVERVASQQPLAVLVNCLPPSNVPHCLPVLRSSGRPFGVYANLGAPLESGAFERSEACSPEAFAEQANEWWRAGVSLVGGCCGTTPEHIDSLAQRLRN